MRMVFRWFARADDMSCARLYELQAFSDPLCDGWLVERLNPDAKKFGNRLQCV